MSNVDPLNPMGGFDWSNPEPTPSLGMPPPPPAVAPGAPNVRPAAQPAATAPKPGQAPPPAQAPVSIEDQLQKLLAEQENIKQQANSLLATQRATADQRGQDVQATMAERPQAPAQETFNQQQPMPDHEQFAKTAPLLTILAALGGKLTKMSGLTMLKATNAMIAGTMSGSQEAYTQAKKVYDDEYAKFAERQKQKIAIYKDQLEAWKDTYQGREKAWTIASNAVGDTLTQIKDVQTSEVSILRAQAQMMKEKKAQQQQAKDRDKDIVIQNWQKAGASYAKLSTAKQALDNAYILLPKVLEKYRNDKNEGLASPVPKPISQWLISTGDTDVQRFSAFLTDAKPMLAALETSGTGSRSNMLLQQMISDTVPRDVFSKGPAEIDTLARQNKATVDLAMKQMRTYVDVWDKRAKSMGIDLPQLPEIGIPESQLPSDVAARSRGAASSGGTMTLDDYLKSQEQ